MELIVKFFVINCVVIQWYCHLAVYQGKFQLLWKKEQYHITKKEDEPQIHIETNKSKMKVKEAADIYIDI